METTEDKETKAEILNYMDTVVKCQLVLYEFHSVMFFLSFADIALPILFFALFVRVPGLWPISVILSLLHFIRAYVGFKINKTIPCSYQITKLVSPLCEQFKNKDIDSDEFQNSMQKTLLLTIKDIYTEVVKYLIAYSCLTLLCFLVDATDFVACITRVRLAGEEY